MVEQNKMEQAKAVFATLCGAMDSNKWHYKKDEAKLTINCGVQGEDLPIEITWKVDPERLVVMLYSHLPCVVQEDKRLDVAVAVSAINNVLVDGSFDYDITSGHMFFRLTNSFIDSRLSDAALLYMLFCATKTIDDYNDKFLMLAKGMLSLEQFLKNI